MEIGGGGRCYIRNVMGWEASPANVIVPFRLSHRSEGQYESLLCQTTAMDSMTCLKGSAYFTARSFKSDRIADPCSSFASLSESQVMTIIWMAFPSLVSWYLACPRVVQCMSHRGGLGIGEL